MVWVVAADVSVVVSWNWSIHLRAAYETCTTILIKHVSGIQKKRIADLDSLQCAPCTPVVTRATFYYFMYLLFTLLPIG